MATSSTKPKFDATDPNAYPAGSWDRYDTLVRLAQAAGLQTYFQFTPSIPGLGASTTACPAGRGSPLGRAPDTRGSTKSSSRRSGRYSGRFAGQESRHRADARLARAPASTGPAPPRQRPPGTPLPAVSNWGIWNEPNTARWLKPWHRRSRGRLSYTQPMIYRSLIHTVSRALPATGHAGDTILIGETANFGTSSDAVRRGLYCVGRPASSAARARRGPGAAAHLGQARRASSPRTPACSRRRLRPPPSGSTSPPTGRMGTRAG